MMMGVMIISLMNLMNLMNLKNLMKLKIVSQMNFYFYVFNSV